MNRFVPCAALLLFAACSEIPDQVEITQTRTLGPNHREGMPKMETRERLGLTPVQQKDESANAFVWETPEGWEELAPAQFRAINLRVAAQPDAQCYLTRLSGDGGGELANVNRWRSQMGLEGITEAQLQELPQISLFGRPARFLSLDGDYAGMRSGTQDQSEGGWRMYAALLTLPMATLTVKMTGPRDVLEAERKNFLDFVESIQFSGMSPSSSTPKVHSSGSGASSQGSGTPKNVPAAGSNPSGSTARSGGAGELQWSAPEHWKSGRTSSMRLATFHPNGADDTELSLIRLAGEAGGLVANVQRWYGQIANPEPSAAEVQALPKLDVLGTQATLIELTGSYSGMSSEAREGYMMLGLIVQPTPEFSLYLKLTGPEAKVRAEKDAFMAFCKSLRLAK
jgi:hypothetical protein